MSGNIKQPPANGQVPKLKENTGNSDWYIKIPNYARKVLTKTLHKYIFFLDFYYHEKQIKIMNRLSDKRCNTKTDGVLQDYKHHLKIVATHKLPLPPLTYKPYDPLQQDESIHQKYYVHHLYMVSDNLLRKVSFNVVQKKINCFSKTKQDRVIP